MKKNVKIVLSILSFVLILLIVVGFKLLPMINYVLAEKAYEKGERTKAIELYTKSCDGKNAKSCNALADMYYNGDGLNQNDDKAYELYTKACNFGNISCAESEKMLDVQEKIKACDKGSVESCRSVGLSYAGGEGVKQNIILSSQYLAKACYGGDIVVCKNLADTFLKLNLKSQATKLYLKACDTGDFASCGILGSIYFTGGDDIPRDYNKSILYFTKSCEGGILTSCGILGTLYFEGKFIETQDYIKANQYLTRACDGGVADTCKILGDMYSKGIRVKQDDEKAFDLYKKACKFGNICEDSNKITIKQEKSKACEGGDAKSCRELGNIYIESKGIEQNYKKAFELYTKACNSGDADGCSKLGLMYRDNISIEYNKNNIEKAQELFEIACNNGFSEGCNNLGNIYYSLYNNPDKYLKSIEPFKKACDNGYTKACENLKNTYYSLGSYYNYDSYYGTKDIKKAKEFYGKGCDLQDQNSCERYAILNKQ